jgi:hypothetical protein
MRRPSGAPGAGAAEGRDGPAGACGQVAQLGKLAGRGPRQDAVPAGQSPAGRRGKGPGRRAQPGKEGGWPAREEDQRARPGKTPFGPAGTEIAWPTQEEKPRPGREEDAGGPAREAAIPAQPGSRCLYSGLDDYNPACLLICRPRLLYVGPREG